MGDYGDLVRDTVDAFNRGDLDAAFTHFDKEVVLRLDPQWPENRTRYGLAETRSFFEDLMANFGNGDSVVDELIEIGDRVLVRLRGRFRGQRSNVQDEVAYTQLVTFRRGRVILFEYFLDWDEAVAEVGLPDVA